MNEKTVVKIGPANQNIPYTKADGTIGGTIASLEDMGRGDCLNQETANAMRIKILRGLPEKITITQCGFDPTKKGTDTYKLVEATNKTTQVNFCVLQQINCVPVFMLPATDELTAKMKNEERRAHMELVFQKCYDTYAQDCKSKNITPVAQDACAATVVAGTKTFWGGNHFTAMVKPPGRDWEHIDPTRFGGPQRINRSQCGGYSSMIEAEALIHYLKIPIEGVKNNNEIKMGFFTKLRLMFQTWFAGYKLKSTNPTEAKGTSYAKMADFSASRIDKLFNNQANKTTSCLTKPHDSPPNQTSRLKI